MPEHFLHTSFAGLSYWDWAIAISAVFLAGCVRGFAGFGLSAVAMACLVLILPPIELIPTLYVLEGAASVFMVKGGIRDADMKHVWPLVIGSFLGLPFGLWVTTSVPSDVSKMIAVLLILTLTLLQFSRSMPPALATTAGRYATGLFAGVVSGLAGVGGMVVALYVLASRKPAPQMRAALTMFLTIGMFTSLAYMVMYHMMTQETLLRGVILSPVAVAGVLLGTWAFNPRLQVYYRRFCLILLTTICALSLTRLMLGA